MASLSRLDRRVEAYQRDEDPPSLPDQCGRCRGPGQLVRWGRFWRRLRTAEREYRLAIRRVRCRACGHAPGLFPPFVARRQLYARPLIKQARDWRRAGLSLARIAVELTSEFLLAPNLVLAWVREGAPSEGP